MKTIKVKLTFIDEVLGTTPQDTEIYDNFIASKAPDALSRSEELKAMIKDEGLEEVQDKSMTVFPLTERLNPFIWDYQIKGFFKDTCGMLRKVTGTESSKLKAYKKEIDGLIFIQQRKVEFNVKGEMGVCQRPLRASTPQGERVALASSETIPAGSTIEFDIQCLKDDQIKLVKEWLDYGQLRGIGQWRNSGKGRFTWEEL